MTLKDGVLLRLPWHGVYLKRLGTSADTAALACRHEPRHSKEGMVKPLLVPALARVLPILRRPLIATTIYTDDNASSDPGPGDLVANDPLEDGSPEHPFNAIRRGIKAASAGKTVVAADGTHKGPGDKELDPGGRQKRSVRDTRVS